MQIRLQKFLAERGVCSRRAAEEMIRSGRITIGGTVAAIGAHVDEDANDVEIDGKPVASLPEPIYIMLHKPVGYVATVHDQFDRPCVIDLVKDVGARVFPVGRLDYDTSGLILLTNDGELAQKLTHPKHEIDKVYMVRVSGSPSLDTLTALRSGVSVDGRLTAPARINVDRSDDRSTILRVTIHEGRNRQVRKMMESVGLKTVALKRIATGQLYLGRLPKGEYRFLTDREVEYLKNL